MYAERSRGFQLRPASLGAALAINGGVIAALLLANPDIVERIAPRPPIEIFDPAPEPSPPPPEHPKPHSERPSPQPTADPLPRSPIDPPPLPPLPGNPDLQTGTGGGAGIGIEGGTGTTEVVVTPVFVAASYDPRYADDLQPPYPDTIRDAGTEGAVRLRIVIGVDGRVIRAEGLAGDPALLKVATRHALARWRFKPATRGGVPEESTKVMVVRFRIE